MDTQITKTIKTHKLIWEDNTKKPWYITIEKYSFLSVFLRDREFKANDFIPDQEHQETYKKRDIKRIEKIKQEEREGFKNSIHNISFDEDYRKIIKKEKFQKWFSEKRKEYHNNPSFKVSFRKTNPAVSFQFDFIHKKPNSTLKEQAEALKEYTKSNFREFSHFVK